MVQPYSEAIEQAMKCLFTQLSEKDRRLYAAVESEKLPHGGQQYLARLFDCSPKTIRRGQGELGAPERLPKAGRIRHPGGGRNRLLDKQPDLDAQFKQVLQEHTAGSPMNSDIRWTNLTHMQIAEHLSELHNSPVGVHIAKQLLKKNKYVRRKARKSRRIGDSAHRDAQFQNIRRLKEHHIASGCPIISRSRKRHENFCFDYRHFLL